MTRHTLALALVCFGQTGCTRGTQAAPLRLGTTTTVEQSGALALLDSLHQTIPVRVIVGASGAIDSEFRNSIPVTHSGGQTGHPTLPFDATPCDRRLRQRVERVTVEARATGCENDDDRLVHALTLATHP